MGSLTIRFLLIRYAGGDAGRDTRLADGFGQTGRGDRRLGFGFLRVGIADREAGRDTVFADGLDRSGKGVSLNAFWFLRIRITVQRGFSVRTHCNIQV